MSKLSLTDENAAAGNCCLRGWFRKKQPEQVRAALIQSAAELAAQQGLSAVTVQAVAQAAGVTKGGFFHHFPHKQALLDAVFDAFEAEHDREIDRLIAEDDQAWGCFTRAYVMMAFRDILQEEASLHVPLSLSMMNSADLCERWSRWLAGRLQQHQSTDSHPQHEIVRLAADGAWMVHSLKLHASVGAPLALREQLLMATRRSDTPCQ